MMIRKAALVALLLLVTACAGKNNNPDDPWEGFNRGMYGFNKGIDSLIAKPVTQGYQAITPDFMEQGISNVFSNLEDVPTMVNNLLQGKFADSFSDLGRFLVNSTIGVAGLWDPGSRMGLEKHDEDFGQTLGAWGLGSGPYLMLPFLGPSTLRDTATLPVNSQLNLLQDIDHIPTRNTITFIELVDRRAQLMAFEDQLEDVIDEYAFVRDIYLQNRQFKVLDGEIPFEEEDCEEEDEEDCEF